MENWREITSDPQILDIVQHCHIEFADEFDETEISDMSCGKFSETESLVIQNEISKLLLMKVITEVEHVDGEVISPIFIVPKKNGEYRMIHNLKKLNEKISYFHFKMDTFESVIKLIKQNDFMASVDLRHAYYSVPIAEEHRKYLRFSWQNKLYEYTSLPNGICCAPRLYTKLMKPVYATLRKNGHTNAGYIDDSLLAADSYETCECNVKDTVALMTHLGFVIHEGKSVLIPTTKILFLGNWIDSVSMTVTLPIEKVHSIVLECRKLYNSRQVSIRYVAKVLGLMVSSFSAVEFGPLFYRNVERQKIIALKLNYGNFDAVMSVTSEMKDDLLWWIENLADQKRHISHKNPDMIITSDASLLGWGASCENHKIGGRWKVEELDFHINYLELLAISLALKSFAASKSNVHIQLKTDNTCALSYINNMGGIRSLQCNELSKQIWQWCRQRNIWISAAHVPGILNVADVASRHFNDNIEWMLNPDIFSMLTGIWGKPDIDLFASRVNRQLPRFVSWKPDAEAENVDAFSICWSDFYSYIFSPFSQILKCVQKLREDQGESLLICPYWPTQTWWTPMMEMLVDFPRIIPKSVKLLTIPGTDKVHPLHKKLVLLACRVSGKSLNNKKFQKNLSALSCVPGVSLHRNNILPLLNDGFLSVVKGKQVPFIHL